MNNEKIYCGSHFFMKHWISELRIVQFEKNAYKYSFEFLDKKIYEKMTKRTGIKSVWFLIPVDQIKI